MHEDVKMEDAKATNNVDAAHLSQIEIENGFQADLSAGRNVTRTVIPMAPEVNTRSKKRPYVLKLSASDVATEPPVTTGGQDLSVGAFQESISLRTRSSESGGLSEMAADVEIGADDILEDFTAVEAYVFYVAWRNYKLDFMRSDRYMRPWNPEHDLQDVCSIACTTARICPNTDRKVWNVRWYDPNEKVHYNMPFVYEKRGSSEKPPLYIAMHGGGNCTDSKNQSQFKNHLNLYGNITDGIYLVPRAPTNSWNMWFRPEVYHLFDAIIRSMIMAENVDSNRVYLFGYSAGGDGAFHVVPNMADRLAAGAAMGGHPNDANFTNLCNTPFANYCGNRDIAYNRNAANVTVGQQLSALHSENEGERLYENCVTTQYPTGHWMNQLDMSAIDWMQGYVRKPTPKNIKWRLLYTHGDLAEKRFYWLSLRFANAQHTGRTPTVIDARYEGQVFSIRFLSHEYRSGDTLVLLLNENIGLDSREPVSVSIANEDNEIVHNSVVDQLTLRKSVVRECLQKCGDPNFVYASEVVIDLSNTFSVHENIQIDS